MEITDIITDPHNIPYIGIWAAGYLTIYSLFSDSNKWREWDTTIKFLYSIIMGLCLEVCVILPLYFININNVTLDFAFVLNKTWIYTFSFSAILTFTLRIIHNKNNILNLIKFVNNKLLFNFYIIGMVLSSIFLYEFDYFYNPYIKEANQNITLYLSLNILFFMIGFGFISYFNMILEDLYFNPPGYKKYLRNDVVKNIKHIILNLYLIKLEISHIFYNMTVKKRLFSIFIIPLLFILIIPFDSAYHTLTPKITRHSDVINPLEKEIYLLIESNFTSFNNPPLIGTYFRYKNKDVFEIHSGKYDKIDAIQIPLPRGKEVDLDYYQGKLNSKYSLLCVDIDLEYEDKIKLEPINNDKDLRVYYRTLSNAEFNVSLIYWENMKIEDVVIVPTNLQRVQYNETHDTWIQLFDILNESPYDIMIEEITYDRFRFGNVDKDSLVGYWNNETLYPIWYNNNEIKFFPLVIQSGTESKLGFSYNVKERYLEN